MLSLRMKAMVVLVPIFIAVLSISPDELRAYEREMQNLSSTLAEKIARAGKKTVAVVDFTDLQGNVTELGRFLAEELSVALAASGQGFEVVDRTHLRAILKEHKLQLSDIFDPKTASELGKIAGVHALLTGTITPFGDNVRLTAKVLDAGTARVIVASVASIAKTKAIEELLARGLATDPSQRQAAPEIPPAPTVGSGPVFQSTSIRATVGQLGVASDNFRAALSVTIENISQKPIYLAFKSKFGWGSGPQVSLSDDRATEWILERRGMSGLHVLPFGEREQPKQSDFTIIAPRERVTVVMNFTRNGGGNIPGTVFSFGADGTYYTASGLQNFSIGLAGIKATLAAK